ncbi:hypothetical protein PCK1_002758 [Pneumocystis canis]|nr:hypothetical protein PCK1_002758 [Pneumocystis canis]
MNQYSWKSAFLAGETGNELYNESEMDQYEQDELEEILDKHKKIVEELNEENFYALLNVDKNATELEIRESYHRLSRAFHPDKHQHPESKVISEEKFRLVQHAYEVLMDPRKRWIYDMYGEDGLKLTWDIGRKFKTADEILSELEKQMYRKKEQNLENIVKSKGHINLVFDASPLFQTIQVPTLSHAGTYILNPKLLFSKIVYTFDKDSFTLGWQKTSKPDSNEGSWSAEIAAGVAASGISYEWSNCRGKGKNLEKLKLTASISTNGLAFGIGTYRKIGENSKAELDLSLTLPQGMIILKLVFFRLGQKIVIPIILCTKYSLKASLWGAIIPISALIALETIYLKPKRIKRKKEKISAIKKEYQERLNIKRKKAEEFLHLMYDMVHRKQYYEKQKEGLFIIKAVYGDFTTGDIIDVTIAIAALVNESQLIIHNGFPKSQIIGIWDPAFGQKKTLRVEYSFKGRIHFVEVGDKHGLIAPLREHLVTNIKRQYF